uniref:Uncharacterized protein n=1 Tax=Lepeophtheirus salmonis TaxID=72036 RepID=A0A0K2U037_LEPSM
MKTIRSIKKEASTTLSNTLFCSFNYFVVNIYPIVVL